MPVKQQIIYICNMVAIFSSGKKQWIRRSISAVLLFLFALSITPKKVLHDALVHHQDDPGVYHNNAPQIIKSGYHCDTDNLVAESPFTGEEQAVLPEPGMVFLTFNHAVSSSLHSTTNFWFTLRGPPATV